MKAETAAIRINGRSVLKVLLQPETEAERKFLEEAAENCGDYELSFSDGVKANERRTETF